MIYNILMFGFTFTSSGLFLITNIIYNKYYITNNPLVISSFINSTMFFGSIFGLFTGNFSIFYYGAIVELYYLYNVNTNLL
jgi:hypothetical protein